MDLAVSHTHTTRYLSLRRHHLIQICHGFSHIGQLRTRLRPNAIVFMDQLHSKTVSMMVLTKLNSTVGNKPSATDLQRTKKNIHTTHHHNLTWAATTSPADRHQQSQNAKHVRKTQHDEKETKKRSQIQNERDNLSTCSPYGTCVRRIGNA